MEEVTQQETGSHPQQFYLSAIFITRQRRRRGRRDVVTENFVKAPNLEKDSLLLIEVKSELRLTAEEECDVRRGRYFLWALPILSHCHDVNHAWESAHCDITVTQPICKSQMFQHRISGNSVVAEI